jgi:energy-coupling factor transporter ATP-binding protein EcfA2
MITRFQARKLSGLWDLDLTFHSDINVLTGRNGAGKTTVLKLLWDLISGNLARAVPEIRFESVAVEASNFLLNVTIKDYDINPTASIQWDLGSGSQTASLSFRNSAVERERFHEIDALIANASGSSVFFPTFRRIEGGFSIASRGYGIRGRRATLLQEAMVDLADTLSVDHHVFVSSISTDDIESLLTQQYADTSREANALQAELSESIQETIKNYDEVDSVSITESLNSARTILRGIQQKVKEIEGKREALFQPFTVLGALVGELLKHKGIRIKDVTTFGDVSSAIEAGYLSAGEKQMLSFLCYNAFKRKSAIFIDEPEISLHVDWQRILFPKLLEQGSENQFVIATHSPFIYSKYADRELRLDQDLGFADG